MKLPMKKYHCFLGFSRMGALLSVLLVSWCASGATVGVNISGFAFQPPSLTVSPGDSVMWTQKDTTQHTSTSDSMVWDSGLLSINQTFTHTFTAAGNFPYHCTVHPFMTASVTVQGAATNPPPSAPMLSAAAMAGGKFQFAVTGAAGQTYIVQASADLKTWNTIQTNMATANVFTVTDSQIAGNNLRFYRVGTQQ